MGTLKARVSGAWLPVLGSGFDAANTVRWNSAWGLVASSTATTAQGGITGTSVDLTGLAVAFIPVVGRSYRTRATIPVQSTVDNDVARLDITDSANTILNSSQQRITLSNIRTAAVDYVENFASTASITRKLRLVRSAGTGTVQASSGTTNSGSITVEDIGPVTPASIAPPTAGPRVVASGNALGIVQMGSFLPPFAAHTVPASTNSPLTNPLVFTMVVGRRYRLFFQIRAINPATPNNNATFYLRDKGADIRGWTYGGDPYVWMDGSYQSATLTWLFDGDDAPHSLEVIAGSASAVDYYTDYGQYYLEDVGPNTSPALPIPVTPPAWTPVTFQNSWVNNGGVDQVCQYRKIGDIVYLRGSMGSGALSSIAFTLPTGFRPPALLRPRPLTFTSGAVITSARADLQTGGGYALQDGSTNLVVIDYSFSTTP